MANESLIHFINSASSNLTSLLSTLTAKPQSSPLSISTSSSICVPLISSSDSLPPPHAGSNSSVESATSGRVMVSMTPFELRMKDDGPAFVGQVFSACDASGNGLMSCSKQIDERLPGWIKKIITAFAGNRYNAPVFRFFMDSGDAASYVKWMNVPSGMVGTVPLDLAYQFCRKESHRFQFVPNKRQVKTANKLLRRTPQNCGTKNVEGLPVFTTENLEIAIATTDGVKWYTPYFFDKSMLDSVIEESVDQHFDNMIMSRDMQRRNDVIDDDFSPNEAEGFLENQQEPPEVQDVIDEMGHPPIPLSVISKVAEVQLFYAVDTLLLGNRWLRKAIGVQPDFPYVVDSFERRSAASFLKASKSKNSIANLEVACDGHKPESEPSSNLKPEEITRGDQVQHTKYSDFRFPFGDWLSNPWQKHQETSDIQISSREECITPPPPRALLPKITMVGISIGDTSMSRASLKKTVEDLTQELKQQMNNQNSEYSINELRKEDRDPLFFANIGNRRSIGSSVAKRMSSRTV